MPPRGAAASMAALALALASGVSAGPPNQEMQGILDRHNVYRCMHGVAPLLWSDAIAAHAQQWAQASGGQMQHSSMESRTDAAGFAFLGENLAKGVTDAKAIDLFYDEIQYTPGGHGLVTQFSMQTGHYTAVVWAETTEVGCGVNGDLLVCQYGPGGNVQGAFPANVYAQVESKSVCGWTELATDSQGGGSNQGGGFMQGGGQTGGGGPQVQIWTPFSGGSIGGSMTVVSIIASIALTICLNLFLWRLGCCPCCGYVVSSWANRPPPGSMPLYPAGQRPAPAGWQPGRPMRR